MATMYSSVVMAVVRWCNGAGLICLIFAYISFFSSSLWKLALVVTVAGSFHGVNLI